MYVVYAGENMKTKEQIEKRLEETRRQYRLVSSDMIDPEREAQIRELSWVLREG